MKRRSTPIITIAGLMCLLLVTSAPKISAADECGTDQSEPVLPRGGSSIAGYGNLVVNNEGADVVIRAENLTPGVAYTAWFIYFDNTSACLIPHQCATADLTMPSSNPAGVLGRMDSAVAGNNGQLTFRGMLRDFHVSAGSSVHIALYAHGLANPTENLARARQLLTPETPALGAPGLGVGVTNGFLVAGAVFDIGTCK
ncbi:MAG TPA: hypothetical protein VGL72_31510 [Bryobacteraceae bacterium]